MDQRWLHAAGLVALAGAAAMLFHPSVPVGILDGTGPLVGLLFVLLAWTGTALLVAAPLPGDERRGASAVAVAMTLTVPFYVLVPDWAGPTYPTTVLAAFAVTHLALAPAVARLVRVGAAVVRRGAVASGGLHALLVWGPIPRYVAEEPSWAAIAAVGGLFFGLLAWGLGTAGSLMAARGAPQSGTATHRPSVLGRHARAAMLFVSGLLLLGVGSLFTLPGTVLWATLLLVVAAVLAAGVWTWTRPAA